jgi:primosomal protein N'
LYIDVILPLPLDGVFTYSVPPELERQVVVGCRVLVPFGRNKTYVGIVAKVLFTVDGLQFTDDYIGGCFNGLPAYQL